MDKFWLELFLLTKSLWNSFVTFAQIKTESKSKIWQKKEKTENFNFVINLWKLFKNWLVKVANTKNYQQWQSHLTMPPSLLKKKTGISLMDKYRMINHFIWKGWWWLVLKQQLQVIIDGWRNANTLRLREGV